MSYINSTPDIDSENLTVSLDDRAFSYRYVVRLTSSTVLYLTEADAQRLHELLGEAIGEAELPILEPTTPGGFSDE